MVLNNIRQVQGQVSRSQMSEGAGPLRTPCQGQVGEGATRQAAALWGATTVTFYTGVAGRWVGAVLTECRSPRPSASSPLPYLFVYPPTHPFTHSPPTHSPSNPPHLPTVPQMQPSSMIPYPCICAALLSLTLSFFKPQFCVPSSMQPSRLFRQSTWLKPDPREL